MANGFPKRGCHFSLSFRSDNQIGFIHDSTLMYVMCVFVCKKCGENHHSNALDNEANPLGISLVHIN